MSNKEASDLIPYDYIGDTYVATAYGDAVFGIRLQMKEVYTMAGNSDENDVESEVNLFYHYYKLALKKLPENTVIQKVIEVYTEKHKRQNSEGCITKRWNEDNLMKRELVREETTLYISIPFKKTKKRTIDNLKLRLSKFEGLQNIEEIKETVRGFTESLKSICVDIETLKGEEILEKYVSNWNVSYKEKDILFPLKVNEEGLVIGEAHTSVLTSVKLPVSLDGLSSANRGITESKKIPDNKTDYREDTKLPVSFLFPLGIGYPVDHTLIETIRIEDKEATEHRINKEKLSLNFLRGIRNTEAINKTEILELYHTKRAEYDLTYCSWGITIIIKDINKDRLAQKVNNLRDKSIRELGLSLSPQNHKSFANFYTSLPGCGRIADNLRLTYLEVASYMTHIESFKRGNSNGIVLTDLLGNPYVMDIWDEKNNFVEARNGVIFAPTGQGKSFLVCHMLDQCFWSGDVIFMVDVGGSYKRLTKANGGEYVDSKNLKDLQFNPFKECYKKGGLYLPELDTTGQQDTFFIEYLSTIILSCYSPDAEIKSAKNVITRAIHQFYKYVNEKAIDPKFDSFYEFMERKFMPENSSFNDYLNYNEFLLVMEKYKSEGNYGFLLNGENSINLKNRWIAFDLVGTENKKEIQVPTLLMVMNMFEQIKNIHYGKRIRIFIEEAVDFLKGGIFTDYIGGLFRKIRKAGGQVFIVTQSITFLDQLDPLVASSILSNCEIKILLNHAKVSSQYDRLIKGLSLSRSEAELIKNQTASEGANYRIGFMKFGSMPGFLFRIEVSQKTYMMYQTNAEEIKEIEEIIEETGDLQSAIETYVEEKNN